MKTQNYSFLHHFTCKRTFFLFKIVLRIKKITIKKRCDPFKKSKLIFLIINSIFLITILINYIRANLNEVYMESMVGSSKLPQSVFFSESTAKNKSPTQFLASQSKISIFGSFLVFLKIVRKVRKMSHNFFYYCCKKLTLA